MKDFSSIFPHLLYILYQNFCIKSICGGCNGLYGIKTAGHEGIYAENAAFYLATSRDYQLINVIFDAEVCRNAKNDGISV
jgi:hypothetical protein